MVHIHFDVDDAMEEESPQTTSSAQSSWSQGFKLPHCCNVASVGGAYVFRVSCNTSCDGIAASTSDHVIKAYSLSSSQLNNVCDLRGHGGSITDVAFTVSPSMLHSSSVDGTIKGWDLRTTGQAESFAMQQELHSFSVRDHLLAVGGQGEVSLWDRRSSSKPLLTLSDTHMEDVTQTRLVSSQHMISASTDGLVAVHDFSRGIVDDDDNFTAALNIGNSVEEIGTYGKEGEKLWVRTGTETMLLWEWRLATLGDLEGGDEAFAHWPEARATAAGAAAGGPAAYLFEEVDYLTCCYWDPSSCSLSLVAGTNQGSVGFFPIQEHPRSTRSPLPGAVLAPPIIALQGIHQDVVRSVQCFGNGSQGPLCVTGGEDGRVCLWSLEPSTSQPAAGQVGMSSSLTAAHHHHCGGKNHTGGQPGDHGLSNHHSGANSVRDAHQRQGGGPRGDSSGHKEKRKSMGSSKQVRMQSPY